MDHGSSSFSSPAVQAAVMPTIAPNASKCTTHAGAEETDAGVERFPRRSNIGLRNAQGSQESRRVAESLGQLCCMPAARNPTKVWVADRMPTVSQITPLQIHSRARGRPLSPLMSRCYRPPWERAGLCSESGVFGSERSCFAIIAGPFWKGNAPAMEGR